VFTAFANVRTALLCALLSCLFIVSSCSKPSTPLPNEPTPPPITHEPSNNDLIQAVRNSVAGKTYAESVPRTEQQPHTCSQMDVETDPYAQHNPELAKCPSAGHVYYAPVTTWVDEQRPCASLPDPSFGWSVMPLRENLWRVSQSGSSWDVEKLEGQAANAGNAIRFSDFAFAITAHQKC
jgi:hypothetical protein